MNNRYRVQGNLLWSSLCMSGLNSLGALCIYRGFEADSAKKVVPPAPFQVFRFGENLQFFLAPQGKASFLRVSKLFALILTKNNCR